MRQYEYKCDACGNRIALLRRQEDRNNPVACGNCRRKEGTEPRQLMRRLYSVPNIVTQLTHESDGWRDHRSATDRLADMRGYEKANEAGWEPADAKAEQEEARATLPAEFFDVPDRPANPNSAVDPR